jgi:hypothetical protein
MFKMEVLISADTLFSSELRPTEMPIYPEWAVFASISVIYCFHLPQAAKPIKPAPKKSIVDGSATVRQSRFTVASSVHIVECLISPELSLLVETDASGP